MLLAAVAAEKRPATHESQADDALAAPYFPTWHAWHVSTLVAAVAAENLPATHLSHVRDPELLTHFPGGQGSHTVAVFEVAVYRPGAHGSHTYDGVPPEGEGAGAKTRDPASHTAVRLALTTRCVDLDDNPSDAPKSSSPV